MYTELGVKRKKTAKRRVVVANVPCRRRKTLPVQSEFLSGTTVLLHAVEKCIESSAQVYVVFFRTWKGSCSNQETPRGVERRPCERSPSCRLAILNSVK